ncbi:SLATT domain-containing protein [Streptomyces sp. NPDC006235]|uniref:SLATT domain-containing protein n=1 Tax=Streptomyces sp. NPDC006235 TaxID=3156736 RepID=UPI0033BDBA9F
MNQDGALAYIEGELDKQVKSFKSSKQFFRTVSLIETISAATLGALTTLFIALSEAFGLTWLKVASLISASLTTVAAAWVGWFSSRPAWVSKQKALNDLYALKSRITFEKEAEVVTAEKIEEYRGDLQKVLHQANAEWEQLHI